jgi:transposase
MGKEKRRKFDREFKSEAVKLVIDEGRPITTVARNLGIHGNLLHKWKKQYEEDFQYAFPGKGRLKEPDEEMRRLRKELADTKEERDILKKLSGHSDSNSLSFFYKNSSSLCLSSV